MLSFQLLQKKARRLDTFLYIRDIIHRFNSIIYKSISFSTSFHSNFLHTSQYTPFHSISREKRKDSKIRFLFLLLDFFTTARKRNTLLSFRRKTRYKKKKEKEIEMILASEETCSRRRGTWWLNDKTK